MPRVARLQGRSCKQNGILGGFWGGDRLAAGPRQHPRASCSCVLSPPCLSSPADVQRRRSVARSQKHTPGAHPARPQPGPCPSRFPRFPARRRPKLRISPAPWETGTWAELSQAPRTRIYSSFLQGFQESTLDFNEIPSPELECSSLVTLLLNNLQNEALPVFIREAFQVCKPDFMPFQSSCWLGHRRDPGTTSGCSSPRGSPQPWQFGFFLQFFLHLSGGWEAATQVGVT